jgi:hypothetical protein
VGAGWQERNMMNRFAKPASDRFGTVALVGPMMLSLAVAGCAHQALQFPPRRQHPSLSRLRRRAPVLRDPPRRYGSVTLSEEYVTTDTADGKPELFSANNQLSTAFGVGYGYAKGSYRGTATRPAYPQGGPGVTNKRITKPVWFSCSINGAEGDDHLTGQAVGWTSKKTAWLVG